MSPVVERRVRRDPVDDLLVHRRAQRRRIAAVALERRLRARRRAPSSPPPRRAPPSSRPAPPSPRAPPSTCATSAFAARIRSSSAGDLQTITARLSASRAAERRVESPHRSPPSRRPAAGCRRSTGTSAAPRSTRRAAWSAADTPSTAPARSRRRRRCACTSAPPHLPHVVVHSIGAFDAALAADPPRRQPPHQHVFRHHDVDARPAARVRRHQLVQRRRLHHRARKAVEHEPARARPAGSAARGRSRSSCRRRPACRASIVALAARPSSVPACTASRRMSPVEIFGSLRVRDEPLRLRALPGPGRTEHDDVQRRGSRRWSSPPTGPAARGCGSSS